MQLLQRMRAVKDDPGAVEECCFRLADDPLQLADVPPAQVAYEVGAGGGKGSGDSATAVPRAPARPRAVFHGVRCPSRC